MGNIMSFFRLPRWVVDRPFLRGLFANVLLVCVIVATAVGGALLVDWIRGAEGEAVQAPPPQPTLSPFYAQLKKKTESRSPSDNWQTRKLEVGSPAPDFSLPTVLGEKEIRLSDFRGRRPVVLVFGSFSCDTFCDRIETLERFYQDHKERAEFVFVNVSEAGHEIPGLEFVLEDAPPGSSVPLPVRREKIARAMKLRKLSIPGAIETADAPTETAYSAFPLRLVVVDTEGRIALDLGHSMDKPWDLGEVERAISAPTVREEGK